MPLLDDVYLCLISHSYSQSLPRVFVSLIGIILCVVIGVNSARFGFSRLLGHYAIAAQSFPAATESVRLAPKDAEAHRSLAINFRNGKMYREAEREMTIATSLRPKDDLLWLELAALRDQLDNSEGALVAMDQAVAAAPYYAHTHRERGNIRALGVTTRLLLTAMQQKSNRNYVPTD